MKTKLLLLLTLIPLVSFAKEETFDAVVRTDSNKAVIEKVKLEDLLSENSFDGKYFKIVKGKSDEALAFDSEEGLKLRAATTYHHLTKARDYFVHHLGSDYVAGLPKIVIRLEHKNQFSELGHFAHDNYEPQFNNALTIPAGRGLPSKGVKPWDIEIWFRPSQRIHISELSTNDLQAQEFQGLMRKFRSQIHMQSLTRFIAQMMVSLTNPNASMNPLSTENLVRTAGSSVIMEAGYQFIDPITKFFSRKWYWLDTALIPEIIYHEYSHVALSDHLKLLESTAVIEGMADFFAGQIANSPKLAKHIKKYNTYNGKDAKRKQNYRIEFESTQYANTDFVFGLLWELKKIVGEEDGEFFMFDLRKNVTTYSTIRTGLVEGILKTCDEKCDAPFVDKLRILKALNLKKL